MIKDNKILLPKVFIFEGGDVCGKTTQVEAIYGKLKNDPDYKDYNIYQFKFPNKFVYFDIDDPYVRYSMDPKMYWCMKNCIDQNYVKYDGGVWDIYSLFESLHKFIYNNNTTAILKHDWNAIESLIYTDIILNAYDKCNWVNSVYRNIVNDQEHKSIVLIDRFVDSGTIYNTLIPTQFIIGKLRKLDLNEEDSNLYRNLTNSINDMCKLSETIEKQIYEEIFAIQRPDIPSFVNFLRKCDISSAHIPEIIREPFLDNITHIYFKESKKLYEKFKKEVSDNSVEREVSGYDTNETLRSLTDDNFRDMQYKHNKKLIVNTDNLIDSYHRANDTDDLYESCINYCTDEIMSNLSL